jgi:hypothetical protein
VRALYLQFKLSLRDSIRDAAERLRLSARVTG